VHEQRLPVASFYLDKAPVSCKQYADYLEASKYVPPDERGFLQVR
jgi:formylglycine-generating enzyme required for sulfatase activity